MPIPIGNSKGVVQQIIRQGRSVSPTARPASSKRKLMLSKALSEARKKGYK